MKKIIKEWGNGGLGIYFGKDEINILKIKEGDLVEIEIKKLEENIK